jgi:lysophospholipase L1-like esterase
MGASPRIPGRFAPFTLAAAAAACASAVVPAPTPALPPGAPAAERIVFLGDSLVHRSNQDHGLLAGIEADLRQRHPDRRFELVDAGSNGDRIADIAARLERDVLARRPAAVVLYWDSDVSDVDERALDRKERRAVRDAYRRALVDVLTRLVASGAHVIVSGPTLIGERPLGQNPKDPELDAYRALNRAVCRRLHVPYVDTRYAFLSRRPAGVGAEVDKDLFTEDGEHLNDRGTGIVREEIGRALEAWVRGEPAQLGLPRRGGWASAPPRPGVSAMWGRAVDLAAASIIQRLVLVPGFEPGLCRF